MPFQPAPQPCWLILIEDDWVGCGDCWRQATSRAGRIWAEEIAAGAQHSGPPVVVRADGLCVVVTCSGCGAPFLDPATGQVVHEVSMVWALRDAAGEGWLGDVCPACQAAELMP